MLIEIKTQKDSNTEPVEIIKHKTLEERKEECHGRPGLYKESDWREEEGREFW